MEKPSLSRKALQGALLTALISLAVLIPTGILIARALAPTIARHAGLLAYTLLGVALCVVLAGLRYVFAWSRLAAARARQAELVTLHTGAVAHVGTVVRHGERWADRALQIELIKAQPLMSPAPPPAPSTIIEVPLPALPAPAATGATINLRAAQLQGWASATQWLVGMDAQQQPQQIVLKHTGLIGIGGVQGQGKTNTAAWLLAQAAAAGAVLFIADPHHGDADSLSAQIAPFSGAVQRIAVSAAEINALIVMVWRIYDRRCKDPAQGDRPVVFWIDEFLELMLRQQLSEEALTALGVLGGGGRKKQIFGGLNSTNWSATALGPRAQTIRQGMTHTIVHRCSQDTAKFLLPPGGHAAQAMTLAPGQAIFFGGQAPALISVPELSDADRALAAQAVGLPPKTYAPWASARIAPTASIGAQPSVLPPPPPPTPPTNQQRILTLLGQQRSSWLTHAEIAQQLGIGVEVVTTECKELYDQHQLQRKSTRRGGARYEYQLNQSTSQLAHTA